MPKKIRELKAILQKAGFVYRPGKGSPLSGLIPDEPVTIAGKDGDDARRDLEKQVNRVLEKLEEIENQKEIEEEQ
ncbi:MAG: hypothetical protein C4322_07735 [Mastigocladus sp. ERB_26_1]